MRKVVAVLLFLLVLFPSASGTLLLPSASAQEPTDEPTAEVTPESSSRYEQIDGVTVRWEYVITAGDIMTAGLVLLQVASVWIFAALFFIGKGSKRG